MLAHRSGLPAYTGDLLTRLGHDAEQALHRLRFLVPDHSFRERWAYSNYGIFVAGIAGARAAGSTKERVVVDRLFAPLGMGRSGPVLAELTKDGNHASGHDIDGTIMPPEDVDAFNGAGAFVSTGADMARWLRMMLAGGSLDGRQVLKPETVEEIYAASMVQGVGGPLQDPNDSAGLGRESYRFLLDRVVEKNGALNGIRTIATLVPEKRIGIMVLANKQLTVFPEAVRAEFLERYLGPSGRDLQAEIRAQQPGWDALVELPAPLATAEPLGRDLGTLAGRYESRLQHYLGRTAERLIRCSAAACGRGRRWWETRTGAGSWTAGSSRSWRRSGTRSGAAGRRSTCGACSAPASARASSPPRPGSA
jgi:CubicO group peptidase (beta-lactamase class C family)